MVKDLSVIEEVKPAKEYRVMDRIAAECLKLPEQEAPLVHTFTKGLYTREIFLKAGTVAVTKIHNTQHPYVILRGKCSVSTDGENWESVEGPLMGITEPGTQRLILVHEDTVWITFHPNPEDEKDLLKIEERIIKKYEIPQELIDGPTPITLESNEESLK